jgi:hypothetical protein
VPCDYVLAGDMDIGSQLSRVQTEIDRINDELKKTGTAPFLFVSRV